MNRAARIHTNGIHVSERFLSGREIQVKNGTKGMVIPNLGTILPPPCPLPPTTRRHLVKSGDFVGWGDREGKQAGWVGVGRAATGI